MPFFSVAKVYFFVALLAEGVDRNTSESGRVAFHAAVALLAEGVDRNHQMLRPTLTKKCGSPSSRRAWIEIGTVAASPARTTGRPPRGGRG